MSEMGDLVGHILVFGIVVVVGLLLPMTLGRLIRPKLPTPEKDAIYECGEPTIGSSYIQFDLRFYVVALLFIVFDVEVAFFFPWSTVYGGAMQLADTRLDEGARQEISAKLLDVPIDQAPAIDPATGFSLGVAGLVDVLVFFGVLLVGFAYLWKRGDLDWIRAATQKTRSPQVPSGDSVESQAVA